MKACQTSSPGEDQTVAQRPSPASRSRSVRQMINGPQLRDDVGMSAGVRHHARRKSAEQRAHPGGQPRDHELAGEHEVPRDAGECQRKSENPLNATCGPNSRVTGAIGMETAKTEVLAIMFTPSGNSCGPRRTDRRRP